MKDESINPKEENLEHTELGPRTTSEVWKDWGVAVGKYIWKKVHSPMGVYFFATWIISVLIMGFTYNSIGGSFWEGPKYWITVFLTFGLNAGQEASVTYRFIAKPVVNWLLSPMLILIMGTTLFFLGDSGFLRNSATPELIVEQADFRQQHKFFNYDGEIWGIEVLGNSNNPKWTSMYLWIVFAPIIFGAIIAGVYNSIMFKIVKKQGYLPKVKNFLIIVFFASIFVGIKMALMSGDITLEFSQIFISLFIERRNNYFLIYGLEYSESRGEQGQYHPIALALTMWLIYLIVFLIVYAIFLFIGNLDRIWRNKDVVYRKVKEYIIARKTPILELQEE